MSSFKYSCFSEEGNNSSNKFLESANKGSTVFFEKNQTNHQPDNNNHQPDNNNNQPKKIGGFE